MEARYIQSALRLNASVLTGLYQEVGSLRNARKHHNEKADKLSMDALLADQSENFEEGAELQDDANAHRAAAVIYTPYIKKFKAKIAKMEKLQKALKRELRDVQDNEWLIKIFGLIPDEV